MLRHFTAEIKRVQPAASANVRERAVIHMGLLRAKFSVVQKGSLSGRPRAAHLYRCLGKP